jgi:transposase
MKRPHASRDVRERAMAALDAGSSVADIARCIHSDPSTIRRWRLQRRRTGSVAPRPRSGRPSRLQAADRDALEAQVTTTPDATLAAHCAQWQQTHGIQVSQSTMSRLLRQLGFTRKKRP